MTGLYAALGMDTILTINRDTTIQPMYEMSQPC